MSLNEFKMLSSYIPVMYSINPVHPSKTDTGQTSDIKRNYYGYTYHVPGTWTHCRPSYPQRMLIISTYEFVNSLMATTHKYWDEQDQQFIHFVDKSSTILSTTVTSPYRNLRKLLMEPTMQEKISRNQIIFIHCLNKELDYINSCTQSPPLQSTLDWLVTQYCEIIQYLLHQGKMVIVSEFPPIADTAINLTIKHLMNANLHNQLNNRNIAYHRIAYNLIFLPLEQKKEGFHLTAFGVNTMIQILYRKLSSIYEIARNSLVI